MRPFPDIQAGRPQVSTAGGITPLWSRDGQELFYRSPEGDVMGVRVLTGSAWRSTAPTLILPARQYYRAFGGVGRTFDISPDGQRFLMIKQVGGEAPVQSNLVIVENWFEELKRLVPTS